jgi:hypothetical protein
MENELGSASDRKSGLAQRLKEDGRETLEQRKRSAAERVDEIAQAIGRVGAQFSENEPTLAGYADRIASTVGNFATQLREGSLEDLIDDTRALARRNPGLFIAGGVALGFALSRFVKASAGSAEQDDDLSASEFSSAGAPTLTDEIDDDVTATSETVARGYGDSIAPRSNGG